MTQLLLSSANRERKTPTAKALFLLAPAKHADVHHLTLPTVQPQQTVPKHGNG